MSKNKSLGYDRYVISDMFPISILDMDTGDSWPLADEGIFETVCELLNKQDSENYQLKQAYADAKADVEKKEQILKDIMRDNLLIHDSKKGVRRMDEKRLQQIAFAELLNQLGVNTGVNTEKLLKKELEKWEIL